MNDKKRRKRVREIVDHEVNNDDWRNDNMTEEEEQEASCSCVYPGSCSLCYDPEKDYTIYNGTLTPTVPMTITGTMSISPNDIQVNKGIIMTIESDGTWSFSPSDEMSLWPAAVVAALCAGIFIGAFLF